MAPPRVRPARPSDLRHLAAIEDAGGPMFEAFWGSPAPEVTGPAPSGSVRDQAGTLLVSGLPPTGFAHLIEVEGHAHLEQVSVHPDHQRAGLGAALVRAAMEEARWAGHDRLTLCTYRDVPWNGPFYRSLGFADLTEPEPWLARILAREESAGLTRYGARTAMGVRLSRT